VERRNEQAKQQSSTSQISSASQIDTSNVQKITLQKGETITTGGFDLKFEEYRQVDDSQLQDSTMIAIRAHLDVRLRGSDSSEILEPLFAIYKEDGKNWAFAPPVQIPGHNASIQFSSVDPATGEIELTIHGLEENVEEEWVLLVAEEKPFISVVWLGTFILMAGFSISIVRHWRRKK
jgi:cytochrome c-type biogenesis protein CcmF